MSDRTRDSAGKFVETLTPERVLAVMRETDAPVVTARDIADALNCTPEGATKKLKQLRDQGRVERQKVGSRAVVWWQIEQEPSLDTTGEHNSDDQFFSAPPLGGQGDRPINAADTDELLSEAIARETDSN
jgi:hypothetical protein